MFGVVECAPLTFGWELFPSIMFLDTRRVSIEYHHERCAITKELKVGKSIRPLD